MHDTQDVLDLLHRHVARLDRRIDRLTDRSRRFAQVRLAIVLIGVIGAYLGFQMGPVQGWSILGATIVCFAVVARWHRRVDDGITRHRVWRRLKQTHVARMTLDWDRLPPPLPDPVDPDHPFASDLNVTGRRSLHHLLDTAATRGGSLQLRTWLLDPVPEPDVSAARQHLVRALMPLSIFRDRLALLTILAGSEREARWDDAALLRWLHRTEEVGVLRPWLLVLGLLAVCNIVGFLLYVAGWLPPLFAVTLILYLFIYLGRYRASRPLFDETHDLQQMLARFSPSLRYLEQCPFPSASRVAALCAPLRAEEGRPSQYLRRLERIAGAAAITKSELLLAVFNLIVPWEMFFTYLLHQAKAGIRAHLPGWLDVWYQVEALSALAGYAAQHPHYVFPEIQPDDAEPVLTADQVGHPLLPGAAKVRNDATLAHRGTLWLITGSNMSGKSTFLRTLGLNLCLAFAGGPADAQAFRTIPFRLFSSMNVSDSVQDGLSYFYAEVRRLKALLDAVRTTDAPPVFFLIDEIFRGTNNRERLLGSQAFVRALLGEDAAGLIATHDLELVKLADEHPSLHNYHFREDIANGRMVFDYTLRPGPCPTTNALTIMRLEGLPVAREEEWGMGRDGDGERGKGGN